MQDSIKINLFLLININGQCVISISFGYSLKKFILSIIKSEKQLQEVISHNIRNSNNEVIENLSIIYLEPNMRVFDHIINENSKIKDNLIKLIKYLDSQFDFIIIDTPSALVRLTILHF